MSKRFLLLATILGTLAIPSFASLLTYTSASAFNSANADQTFVSLTFSPLGSVGTSFTDLSSGILFTDSGGLSIVANPGFGPQATGNVLKTDLNGTNLTITGFPSALRSFSFYIGGFGIVVGVDVASTNTTGDAPPANSISTSTSTGMFYGIRSSSPISSVTLTHFTNFDNFGIMALQLGSPTGPAEAPEGATMLLIGTGLIGFCLIWKKQMRPAL